jgi:CRP-like cAMP-binding protein
MDTSKFPHHLDCEALTGLTADHLPRDGSLGRVRRYPKGADLWQSEDPADRVYFLRRGRVEITTATPDERPVVLRTIEAGQPFGELCVCTSRAGTRDTTAHALVACEAIEIKLNSFVDYLREDRAAVTLGRLRRRGLVHYRREGPLRVDVPGLTAYLGRLAHEEAG